MNAQPAIAATQLLATVRRLHRAHWGNAAAATTLALYALTQDNPTAAVAAVLVGLLVFAVLHSRVTGIHRTRLDPCFAVGASTITDIRALVDYYASAVAGPETVRFAWLPPLTTRRAIARRAGNPWWAPRANLAYSGRIANARSTVIMPFLVNVLHTARADWNCPAEADAAAVAAVKLREAWSTDILRQQSKDAEQYNEAAAAWLLLGL